MRKIYLALLGFVMFLWTGCDNFLDERPQKSLVIPSTLEDFQAILDDHIEIIKDPSYGEISADDYFLPMATWLSLYEEGHRRTYLWEKDYLFGTNIASDWLTTYRMVYAANTVLEKIDEVPREGRNSLQWDNVKGQAHFLRARSFLSIAGIWTLAYDSRKAKEMLGIPIRMESDFNIPSTRSSLEDTYSVILDDLKQAEALLPTISIHPTRASKPAALALQARTYLFMRDYDNCWIAANACLQLKDDLLDYNQLRSTDRYPIPQFNTEVIYVSEMPSLEPIYSDIAKIDSILYRLYDDRDLRKKMFFHDNGDGTFGFKGGYDGSYVLFSGLATDEVYLMRAESALRKGSVEDALRDLNWLLKARWDNQYGFESVTVREEEELLGIILAERRKQLLMRGIRWPDIKRLNLEGRNIILKRNIGDHETVLLPNDLRYALPIPEDIIALSGMEQNPR